MASANMTDAVIRQKVQITLANIHALAGALMQITLAWDSLSGTIVGRMMHEEAGKIKQSLEVMQKQCEILKEGTEKPQ